MPERRPDTADPPDSLDKGAQALWRQIVASRAGGYFTPGDLPLLEEYCRTSATLLPRINQQIQDHDELDPRLIDTRDKLCRIAASLAGKLRLCVSSRTRPDTASMRDSTRRGPPPWQP